jgi:putative heme-binding domain-containing protein
LACHGVEAKSGSEVGPNLSAIGAERDVAYLLESMLTPGASIAQGYGLVSVTLKDGSTVGGTLARETPSTVAVRQFDGATKTISRSEIASQTPAISIMPPMLGILQPREIRDVVAYLASLKPKPRGNSAAKAAGGE